MEDFKKAIVPITFVDDEEYNYDNDSKMFVADMNELFVNPYNFNTIYRPINTVEPTDDIIYSYNESIKLSKLAYVSMNVEELVINFMYEIISDIFEPHNLDDSNTVRIILTMMKEKFIDNLYIHTIIENELLNIKYIDTCMGNMYTRIIVDIVNPFVSMVASELITHPGDCKNLYNKFRDDGFDSVLKSKGNTLYCRISSIIRDIAEVKMCNMRRLFDVIKQTYLNMGQFAADYHIDPVSKVVVSSNDDYYKYLLNEKYNVEGGEDV